MMGCRLLYGVIAFVSVLGIPVLARAAPFPSIAIPSRAEVIARAESELPDWRKKLPATRPRLFFTAKTWRALRERYAAAIGREREYFDEALARAWKIVSQPNPIYSTPEEMRKVDPTLTPLSALEELWQRRVGDDMVTLSFALALTGEDQFRDKLHQLVLTACAYPQWGWPGQKICNRDLACGHVARGIAIAYDWHPEIWNEADRTVICETIRARVEAIKAGAYGDVSWAGHYNQNHLQVSVGALGLCGLAFLDEIPEAAEWTALALTTFEQVASQSNADGSSEEGIPYWSYGLCYTLQYIEGANPVLGTHSLYAAPFFRNCIAARLHASTPDLAGTLPWGDAVTRDYYGPQPMLYRLASEYRDGAGQFLATHLPFAPTGGSDVDVWTALWYDPSITEKTSPVLDYHGTISGITNTRSGWTPNDYLLSFKTGFTNANHGHLDSGALAFCFGNDWLLKAPGYGTGKGEGEFWDRNGGRWNYLSNSTESHSALLINGRNQRFTPDARSTIDSVVFSPGWVWTSADLTGAYEDVTQVRRSILHRRGDYILVFDEVVTPEKATVEWLAQVPPDATARGGSLTATSQAGSLEIRALLPPSSFATRVPTREKNDVPAERLKTYAFTQKGTSLHFVTALIPRSSTAPFRLGNLISTEETGRQQFKIAGADWQDVITLDSSPDPKTCVQAVRMKGEKLDSILVAGALEIAVDELVLQFKTRADLALQRAPDGSWELDVGTTTRLAAPLPSGWRFTASGGGLPSQTVIPPGHYRLEKGHR